MTTLDPRVKARIERDVEAEERYNGLYKSEANAMRRGATKEAERAAVLVYAAQLVLLTHTTLGVKADEVKHIVPIDSLAGLSLALDQYLEGK